MYRVMHIIIAALFLVFANLFNSNTASLHPSKGFLNIGANILRKGVLGGQLLNVGAI